ncbi:MAG: pentapeptide repeat-containing protein [Candidatus Obscuribacterales bacterium]|nr:pentapeptide repeat-containing protein [Candidatus Obscuribacterales bacterium]
MHQPLKSISKSAELLNSVSNLLQDFWAALTGKTLIQPINADSAKLAKRWSSSTLSKAPGRLKPISHLQYAKQQKNCSGETTGLELKRSELEDMVRDGICMDETYLAFADLSYAFLSNGRFRGSNLAGANMARAIVIGGNFMDANLRNACLVSADLRHCNFHYADLSGANLRGANLSGADLSGANLWGADLFGANLEGALLAGSTWNPPNI